MQIERVCTLTYDDELPQNCTSQPSEEKIAALPRVCMGRRREGRRERKKNAARSASESKIRWSARRADTFLFFSLSCPNAIGHNYQ